MPEQITSTAGTLWSGLTSGFSRLMNFIPSLLGGLVILLVGWFISKFIGRGVERLLVKVKVESIAEKANLNDFLPLTSSGSRAPLSRFAGGVVKWFFFLIFIQAAAISMGIEQISVIINSIILFIPNILVAVAIFVLGAWGSRYLSGVVESSTAKMGYGSPNVPALFVRYGVLGFTVIASVNQLGIATNLINILFTGLVASLAIAFGLAFGLGGRDAASDITRTMMRKGRSYLNGPAEGKEDISDESMTH